MKDQLSYEETEKQMTEYLLQNNIIFKKCEDSDLPQPSFNVFYNNKRNKKVFVILNESYHFITLVFKPNYEEYCLNDTNLFVKVSKAKKEYEDNQIVEQQKKNFNLLKLLKGE